MFTDGPGRALLGACAAALLAAVLCALLSAPAALAAPAAGHTPRANPLQALLGSSDLWSTIDVCSPADQPDWVGVRGSMPGDGHARDHMYMSFRLQYMNTTQKRWVNIPSAVSSYVVVGTGASARQGGTSFELKRRAVALTLRGVVSVQWRRGASVLQSATRATSEGHHSLKGADPSDYSASTCVIG